MGGVNTIGKKVENNLKKNFPHAKITRIMGNNRYDTKPDMTFTITLTTGILVLNTEASTIVTKVYTLAFAKNSELDIFATISFFKKLVAIQKLNTHEKGVITVFEKYDNGRDKLRKSCDELGGLILIHNINESKLITPEIIRVNIHAPCFFSIVLICFCKRENTSP